MGNLPKTIGSQNKSYEVLDVLGEGGTSVVYLAKDGKKDVAIKILGEEVEPAFKDQYVKILKNEFEVLSNLRHPNIAEVYDFGYSPELGKYFFTTEYVKGADIYNYTSNADLRTKEDLFVQMLVALDYVHRCGVIHCDIKCGNALVTTVRGTPVLKLVDFGFATSKLASTGDIVGTIHYLAPELLVKERKDVDHKIDIYAAGIVFYRLLHRAYPYSASAINDILKWHREGALVPFADELPDYIKQLITRMIATYPSERIATCAKAVEFINFRTEGRYKKTVEKIVGLQFREGPLVGRSGFLDKAQAILRDIKALKSPKDLGLVCLGPQGIGKSRLFKEIKYRTELDEIPIKEFTCVESKNHVEEFIGKFKEIEEMDSGAHVTEEGKKLSEAKWINSLIEKYKKGGLLILIDDFQTSDSAFIKFVNLMEERLKASRSGGEIPIALAIASRPRSELNDIIGKWFDKSEFVKVGLPILSRSDVEDYVGKVGIADKGKNVEQILSFSGGIPGLVEAYCQHLLSPAGSAKPPASLAQSYVERAKYLSKKAFSCLEIISAARRSLSLDHIATLTKLDKEDIQALVRELVTMGFANLNYPSMDVNVTNKAIAQVVKSNLEETKLKDISLRLGTWLESHDPQALPEIAEYFDEAKSSDRAQCYAESAAKQFEEKFNNSEAARYYEMALSHVSDETKRRNLIRVVSKMNVLMGRYKNAISKLEELISLGDQSLDNYRFLGMAYAKMHDYDNSRKWYEEGLKKMTEETVVTDLVQFKNSLGNVFFYMGNLEQSEKYFTEAIADATECLLLNNNLGLILNAKGNYEQAIKFYDGRKKYLSAKKNKRALSLCYSECGYIHMTNNKFFEAIKDLEESYKLAADIGDWYNILVIIGNLVRCCQQTAQYSKALEYALKGLEVEGSLGSVEEIAQNHLTIGILYEAIGVLDLSVEHINAARDRFQALNNEQMQGWCHLGMSFVHKDMDEFDLAIAELDKVDKISESLKLNDLGAWAKYGRADLLCEYGKTKEAAVIVNKMPTIQSLEFELRRKLLELKIGLGAESEILGQFKNLYERSNDFPELKWEIYSALGTYLEKKGKADETRDAFRHSFEEINVIANNLSEAYKDSYKSQRFRMKVVQKFQPDFYSKVIKIPQDIGEIFNGKTKNLK